MSLEDELEQLNRLKELVRITRKHPKRYFRTREQGYLNRSKTGEHRIDQFLEGKRLNSKLEIIPEVVQGDFLNDAG